ncbi:MULTISPECIES: PspC domain-containing protein [unclassified Mesobacillus]|uniref:PspC domain-containing protein n=1 Tax=unclassified Mesobacillus TaxID=2675270 RepID=UPI002040B4A3|nr:MULTISPECIES: PspC domain-containing protein [unclassified Mesobacillus]MCM3125999.1 PspC domain-containing protein [Mesobacillus sp. MER 33]MCM3235985.1 PspC domain-containing protein [Mesobacillus sp. MER 48]
MMKRNRLMRSNSDYVFLGVCGGIAEALLISSIIVRMVFILVPVSPILYLILGALMEKDDSFYVDRIRKKSTFKTVLLAFIFTAVAFLIFFNLGLL